MLIWSILIVAVITLIWKIVSDVRQFRRNHPTPAEMIKRFENAPNELIDKWIELFKLRYCELSAWIEKFAAVNRIDVRSMYFTGVVFEACNNLQYLIENYQVQMLGEDCIVKEGIIHIKKECILKNVVFGYVTVYEALLIPWSEIHSCGVACGAAYLITRNEDVYAIPEAIARGAEEYLTAMRTETRNESGPEDIQ